MITKELKDVVKSATNLTDATGKRVMMTDAVGSLSQIALSKFGCTDLNSEETGKSVIPLKDFTVNYVQDKTVGHILTDTRYSNSSTWYVGIPSVGNINIQTYVVMVLKNSSKLTQTWANITLLFIPSSKESTTVYIVNQQTKATASDYSVNVLKIEMSAVATS